MATLTIQEQADAYAKQMGYKSFADLQASPVVDTNEANEIIKDLNNKITKQVVTAFLVYSNPYTSMFLVEGIDFGAFAEIFELDLAHMEDFDATKRISDLDPSFQHLFKVIIGTTFKKKFKVVRSLQVIRGAFLNAQAFGRFVDSYMLSLTNTIELFIYNHVTDKLLAEIKYSITIAKGTATTPEDHIKEQWDKIFTLLENMTGVPTTKYNMGLTEADDADASVKKKTNFASMDDMVVIINPNDKADLKTKVLPGLFHNTYFELDKRVGAVIKSNKVPTGKMIVMSKKAYKMMWRVYQMESQAWAENMVVDTTLHAWLIDGIVPYGIGALLTLEPFTTTK